MSKWNGKKIWVIGSTSLYEEIRSALPSNLFQVEPVNISDLDRRTGWTDDDPGLVLVEVETAADLLTIDRVKFYVSGPVAAVAAQPAPALVVKAIQRGVADFFGRPVDPVLLVSDGAEAAENDGASRRVTAQASVDESPESMIWGPSAAMTEIRSLIDKVADIDVPVLIVGEVGTGKKTVARMVHERSIRRTHPLVKMNAAALGVGFWESEPVGHGALLLEDIAEMSLAQQAHLVRVLADGESLRVEGATGTWSDVRILATTHRNLGNEIERGRFRKDLYYRLGVITVALPPLRDRRADIPELTAYFLKKYGAQYDKKDVRLSSAAQTFLRSYRWPGNVRQLESLIQEIVAGGNEEIPIFELARLDRRNRAQENKETGPRKVRDSRLKEVGRRAAQDAERRTIMTVLQETRWNRRRAAEILQISYRTLLYKIKQGGLDLNV